MAICTAQGYAQENITRKEQEKLDLEQWSKISLSLGVFTTNTNTTLKVGGGLGAYIDLEGPQA